MAVYDVYSQQLLSLNNGVALYEPDPAGQYDRVRVGDVGHVTMYGWFQRLFNVFVPEDHPINHLGVPEDFAPLPSSSQATFRRTPLGPGVMRSAKVCTVGGALEVSG